MPKFRHHDMFVKPIGFDRNGRAKFAKAAVPKIGDVLRDVPKPEPEPFSELPPQFEELRDRFIAYQNNPKDFIDWDQEPRDYGEGEWIYRVKPFLEKLGSGAYSDVYAIDDKHVLKVVKRRDSGYKRFVAIVWKNQDNPHLPKIYFAGEWAEKTVYILERLEDDPYGAMNAIITQLLARIACGETLKASSFVSVSPSLLEVARLLEGCVGDLHRGNLMWRGDVPVVTDPET